MKTISKTILFTVCGIGLTLLLPAQSKLDSTGLPGDHFSLPGALELFKKSGSPEEFEKNINSESQNVNNLDLNGDGEVDYIRVEDHHDGDAHALVLQVAVNKEEHQDIAVIEVEKDGDESAIIQIIGDQDIYGEEIIYEPYDDQVNTQVIVTDDESYPAFNVWVWPSIRFIYAPIYRPWISPWRWAYYPGWWRPWRPFAWHIWHPRHVRLHVGFHPVVHHRVVHAHRVYAPVRKTSVTVQRTNHVTVNKYRSNKSVRVTKTSTTVKATGPRGNTVGAKKTTTNVQAHGPRGDVKATKTTRSTGVKKANGASAGVKKSTTKVKSRRR